MKSSSFVNGKLCPECYIFSTCPTDCYQFTNNLLGTLLSSSQFTFSTYRSLYGHFIGLRRYGSQFQLLVYFVYCFHSRQGNCQVVRIVMTKNTIHDFLERKNLYNRHINRVLTKCYMYSKTQGWKRNPNAITHRDSLENIEIPE